MHRPRLTKSGSAWESYREGRHRLRSQGRGESLVESDKFPGPIFTPSTKAAEGHDINVDYEYMANEIGEELASKVRDTTIAVYNLCADYARERGIIIADIEARVRSR